MAVLFFINYFIYLLQVNSTAPFVGHGANLPQRVYSAGREGLQDKENPSPGKQLLDKIPFFYFGSCLGVAEVLEEEDEANPPVCPERDP